VHGKVIVAPILPPGIKHAPVESPLVNQGAKARITPTEKETNSRDSEKRSSAPMSNVFREASATGAASGRGILARVAALVAVLAFALLAFADGSYATESELVPAAAPTDGKTVEVIIGNFTFAPKDLTIAPGTTVKWVNHNDIPHLVAEKALAFKSKAPQNSETSKDVIATQIRSQGFSCNQPMTAERDRLASIPDEGVWLLQCEDGSYRVRLIPHMAAKVERIGQ